MTADAKLERELMTLFGSDAYIRAPIDLHATAMARVAQVRQRPPVLARLRGETIGRSARAPMLAAMVVLAGAALIILAMAAAFAAGGLPSPASGTITYVSRYYSIWTVRGDGTDDHQIGLGECPSVSANGASMVFVSGRSGNVKGQLIAAKGDGSEQHVLPGVDTWTGSVSPDGSQVAWAKDVGSSTAAGTLDYVGSEDELWVSPVSGSPGVRLVPRAATPNVSYLRQAWSPDGDQIAFVEVDNATGSAATGSPADASIWIVNADGSELHQLVTASPDTSISWSPDGRWLAYARDGATDPELRAVAVDGSVDTLVGAAVEPGSVRWSSDGRYLAFIDHRDVLATVVTVDMSDGSPVGARHRGPVIGAQGAATGATVWFDIAWSPDSHNLLIVETRRISYGSRPENFASRLLLVDPEFEAPPTLLLDTDRSIGDFSGCPVTWSNP